MTSFSYAFYDKFSRIKNYQKQEMVNNKRSIKEDVVGCLRVISDYTSENSKSRYEVVIQRNELYILGRKRHSYKALLSIDWHKPQTWFCLPKAFFQSTAEAFYSILTGGYDVMDNFRLFEDPILLEELAHLIAISSDNREKNYATQTLIHIINKSAKNFTELVTPELINTLTQRLGSQHMEFPIHVAQVLTELSTKSTLKLLFNRNHLQRALGQYAPKNQREMIIKILDNLSRTPVDDEARLNPGDEQNHTITLGRNIPLGDPKYNNARAIQIYWQETDMAKGSRNTLLNPSTLAVFKNRATYTFGEGLINSLSTAKSLDKKLQQSLTEAFGPETTNTDIQEAIRLTHQFWELHDIYEGLNKDDEALEFTQENAEKLGELEYLGDIKALRHMKATGRQVKLIAQYLDFRLQWFAQRGHQNHNQRAWDKHRARISFLKEQVATQLGQDHAHLVIPDELPEVVSGKWEKPLRAGAK